MKRKSKSRKKSQNMTKFSPKVLILSAHTDKIVIKLGRNNNLELFVGNGIIAKPNSEGSFCFSKNGKMFESFSKKRCYVKGNEKSQKWVKEKEENNMAEEKTLVNTNTEINENIDCGLECVNIRDAANYIIRLFYNANMVCRSAVVQKILVIAQMKSIHDLGKPMFTDDIVVKPLCFSIDFVSRMYPTVMFDDVDSNENKETEMPAQVVPKLEARENNPDIASLSYFFDIVKEIPEEQKNILKTTYSCFGPYTGNAIGNEMRKLTIHKEHKPGDVINAQELFDYIQLNNSDDETNVIIRFVNSDLSM